MMTPTAAGILCVDDTARNAEAPAIAARDQLGQKIRGKENQGDLLLMVLQPMQAMQFKRTGK